MSSEGNGREHEPSPWIAAATLSSCGFELAVAVGGGAWLGSWIDRHFNTKPWATVAGFLLGLAVGIGSILATLRRINPPSP